MNSILWNFKLSINRDGEWCNLDIYRKSEVVNLKNKKSELFDKDVFHILNGHVMYQEFKENRLMGDSDYAPFNEAMCVNPTTEQIFDTEFIKIRALGHQVSIEGYIDKVIVPLANLFNKDYNCIVLWFGEDMFCQMNLLTILSYLEQSDYRGKVFLNSFREDEFKVNQIEIKMGHYDSVYREVLINQVKPSNELFPHMDHAISIYLDMLKEDNAVVKYIKMNKDVPTSELMKRLFALFPTVGYGDLQYLELINRTR
jgi:hypothetical protein